MEDYKRNGAAGEGMSKGFTGFSNFSYMLSRVNKRQRSLKADHCAPTRLLHSQLFGNYTNYIAGSKKDKRRQQIATRLNKMEVSFAEDRNNYYRGLLHNLQTRLASIQQGTNEDYVRRKTRLEQNRDYELTRLRLWEEYQVKRVEDEYNEAIETATANYDMMVKLLKEKFYDKLQKQVKQLKEDKLLLNLVNASLWNTGAMATNQYSAVSALNAAAAASSSLSMNDRRSLRKREMSSRFTAGETDDMSDSGPVSASMTGHLKNGTGNGHLSPGYTSSSKRRRHYQTRYSSNDELSTGMQSTSNGHHSGLSQTHNIGGGSGNDSNLSDKDYDTLNHLIMNNEDGGVYKILSEKEKSNGRPNTRGSHRPIAGVQGLKPEELNDDLNLLRNAIKREK